MQTLVDIFLHWRTPPFFYVEQELRSGQQDCCVELVDGRVVIGELLQFDSAKGSIELRISNSPRRVTFEQLHSVRLLQPFALRPDTAAARAIAAADAEVVGERDFWVLFRNGKEFRGKTYGFVKNEIGLFLFLVETEPSSFLGCFIPEPALGKVRVGRLVDDTLVAKDVKPSPALAAALDKQEALRSKPLGKYLSDPVIVSRETLTRALDAQKPRLNVRLGELLLKSKLVSQEQLDQALAAQKAKQHRSLGQVLVECGVVSRGQILATLADKLGIPFINVRDFRIEAEALKLMEAGFAHRHTVLPLIRTEYALVIAMEDPLAIDFAEELRFATGLKVVAVMANLEDLKARISLEYGLLEGGYVDSADLTAKGRAAIGQRAEPVTINIEDRELQLSQESPTPLPLREASVYERIEIPKIRVLIVDDEPHIRSLLKIIVSSLGAEVVGEAGDGESAMALFRELAPNLVLLDISMPKLDGIEVLKQIMAINDKVLVIMLSAQDTMDVVNECLDNGARNFILKSNADQELYQLIAETWSDYVAEIKAWR